MDDILTLDEALKQARIATENRPFIRRFCEAMGIESAQLRSAYVKAIVPGGRRQLNIYPGFTDGFASEDEARRACPDVNVWASSTRPGTWGVDHPVRGAGSATPKQVAKHDEVEYELCTTCFTRKTVTGSCNCDE